MKRSNKKVKPKFIPNTGRAVVEKADVDRMIDAMVFGRVFIDELEGFEDRPTIFDKNLKFWASKTIEEFNIKMTKLFKNVEDGGKPVLMMYDINFALLSRLNELSIDEKLTLVNNFDSIVKQGISGNKPKN